MVVKSEIMKELFRTVNRMLLKMVRYVTNKNMIFLCKNKKHG